MTRTRVRVVALLAPALAGAVFVSCTRRRETSVADEVKPPVLAPRTFRLETGLKLALLPNLPGVSSDDLPETTRRDVEVLAFGGGQLRLKWSGTVRAEKPDSARRREDWVRARANAPPKSTPIPEIKPEYENHAVSGTLTFPDFEIANELLLPGLWPEGNATLKGATAIWLSKASFRELRKAGRARIPFSVSSRLLKDPASSLLSRASRLSGAGDDWTLTPAGHPYALRIEGQSTTVATLTARNWFGTYEVLADEENPLVLSALPEPPSSRLLDLFAPANVLRTLLGYRVSDVDTPPVAKEARK